nr:sugar phosphate nucleotidyltransferase [Akkermansia muciniphila]
MHITAGLRISRAFILGAGLGTRLRPLTGILPKPLIPFFHEPLILHSMRRCYDCGIREFIINTHHLAAAGTRCSLNIHGTAAPFISAMNPCCWIPAAASKR